MFADDIVHDDAKHLDFVIPVPEARLELEWRRGPDAGGEYNDQNTTTAVIIDNATGPFTISQIADSIKAYLQTHPELAISGDVTGFKFYNLGTIEGPDTKTIVVYVDGFHCY